MGKTAKFDVLIIGAGPAGIAAAMAASEPGKCVGLVDENSAPGGQIYRALKGQIQNSISSQIKTLDDRGVIRFDGATVYDAPRPNTLSITKGGEFQTLEYEKLILAVGARELFLPFPGWTLPNVMGVGGLQALVKAGLDVKGKRIVVAGTGPLLLAVGDFLKKYGAEVLAIAEQAPIVNLLRFSTNLLSFSSKIGQGISLIGSVGTKIRPGTWVASASGTRALNSVILSNGKTTQELECDYLACAYGFVPNLELPLLLGCAVEDGFVQVDSTQQTSVQNVYCAGEPTGIGGIDLSTLEGTIAGYFANQNDCPTLVLKARDRWKLFSKKLDATFALRTELKELASPDTVVCRCEDVRMSQLVGWESSRAAKLQTRCGMGACQGRICGPATRFLLNWEHGTVRPPLIPVPLAGLETRTSAVIEQPEN